MEGKTDFSKAMGLESPNRAGFSGLSVSVAFKADMSSENKKESMDSFFCRLAIDDRNIVYRAIAACDGEIEGKAAIAGIGEDVGGKFFTSGFVDPFCNLAKTFRALGIFPKDATLTSN